MKQSHGIECMVVSVVQRASVNLVAKATEGGYFAGMAESASPRWLTAAFEDPDHSRLALRNRRGVSRDAVTPTGRSRKRGKLRNGPLNPIDKKIYQGHSLPHVLPDIVVMRDGNWLFWWHYQPRWF